MIAGLSINMRIFIALHFFFLKYEILPHKLIKIDDEVFDFDGALVNGNKLTALTGKPVMMNGQAFKKDDSVGGSSESGIADKWKIFMTLKEDDVKSNSGEGPLLDVFRVHNHQANSNLANMIGSNDQIADTVYVSQNASLGEYQHVYFIKENDVVTTYELTYEILEDKKIRIGNEVYDSSGEKVN